MLLAHASPLGAAVETIRGFGRYWALVWQTFRWTFRRFAPLQPLSEQAYRIGIRSVPVVLTTGLFTGMVLAVQSYEQFAQLQMQSMIGALVAMSMFKELGPVLTALMLAGRVGSAMAAELGTMKVTEQVDALRALACDPIYFLVVPRFVACVLLTPVLTIVANAVGIAGGWLVGVQLLHIDNHYFWEHAAKYAETFDILAGVAKAFIFGGIISTICCFKGLHCGQGAEGVGHATTAANVLSCMMILVVNFFLALIITAAYRALYGS